MADYFDCIQFKELPSGKKYAHKIGSAKPTDEGGFQVYLDSLPISGPKGCSFVIAPQRERGVAPRKTAEFQDDKDLPF